MAFKMKKSPMQRNFPGAFKKETNLPEEEQSAINLKKRQKEIEEAFSSNYQNDPDFKRDQRLKVIKLTRGNLKK